MSKTKKMLLSFFLVPLMFTIGFFASFSFVGAQSTTSDGPGTDTNLICRIFPFIYDIDFTRALCGESNANAYQSVEELGQLVRFFLSLTFIGIIILAIAYIIKAAVKYIRSEGDDSKIEESKKAIKSVFLGIGALIVGLVGLIIIVAFIGAEDALNQDVESGTQLDRFLRAFTGSN